MLSELTVSQFDRWHSELTNRPWDQDPIRYYGNQLLAMTHNIHSKRTVSPDEVDIYYTPPVKAPADWRSIKAMMSTVSGVKRLDNHDQPGR